jgi:hypothetical protein
VRKGRKAVVSRRIGLLLAILATLGGFGAVVPLSAAAAVPPIRHVFTIVLENESEATTYGPGSQAPYLADTLKSEGAFVPNYYGVGHESNDNYIAMISGQAPNPMNQSDCQMFNDFAAPATSAYGEEDGTGCVYPADINTIAGQLSAAGYSWRDYNEQMGADPTREASVCGHPAIGAQDNTQKAEASDMYASRHNPFVYFHSIIDNTTLCDSHVVNLNDLPADLSSPSTIPNYVFITPDLCNDGHDPTCANGQTGGLTAANSFLQTWVPKITSTQTFKEDGLLLIVFDEAATSDTSSCCGEIAGPSGSPPGIGGPGGGKVGAVLLSPCIAPGTVTNASYNHYSMLGSIEELFGLSKLGYAQLPGETTFGSDIYNQQCGAAAPTASIHAPPLESSVSTSTHVAVSWSSSTAGGTGLASYEVQVKDTSARKPSWKTWLGSTTTTSAVYAAKAGHDYAFQVIATNLAGQTSPAAGATTIVPSGVRPSGGHYKGHWHVRRVKGAWDGHAISSKSRGAKFTLRYRGGVLEIIGERSRSGGVARITFDGRNHTVRLHASKRMTRVVIFTAGAKTKTHHLTIKVVRGTVAIEGYAIAT